jgi:hypothetical protein
MPKRRAKLLVSRLKVAAVLLGGLAAVVPSAYATPASGAALSRALAAPASLPGCLAGQIVGSAATPNGAGYWLVGSDGGVFSYGNAAFAGSMGGKPLNKPMVAIVPTQSGKGYWEIAADGGVFAYGDAAPPASNPLPGMTLNAPIVGAARIGASGLELVAADGGVFALGGAPFYGSMGGKPLNAPVTSISAASTGDGYWLSGADGGVFAYGNAAFLGNAVSSPSCSAPPPSSNGSTIVQLATDIMNGDAEHGWNGGQVPYSWGGGHGTSPGPTVGTCSDGYHGPSPCWAGSTTGVDCSGFARWVYYLAYGTDVLGGGNTNSELGRMTQVTTPQPGDLAFFGTHGSYGYQTRHVGIYIGNGNMINALKTGTYVKAIKVSSVSGLLGYWHYSG